MLQDAAITPEMKELLFDELLEQMSLEDLVIIKFSILTRLEILDAAEDGVNINQQEASSLALKHLSVEELEIVTEILIERLESLAHKRRAFRCKLKRKKRMPYRFYSPKQNP